MPTPTTLTIPQPCHEKWTAMTPAARGRHCAACNTVVIDFTQKTDAEILTLLQRTAASCGRFRADQLNRPLLPAPSPAPRWRTWLAATAVVLGLREVAAAQAHGQQPAAIHRDLLTHDERKLAALRQRQQQQADTTSHVLHGKVVEKATGQGLPGVTVLLKNTTMGVATGPNGSFELLVPSSLPSDQLVLFSSIGFVKETRPLDMLIGQHVVVELAYDNQALGEMVIVGGVTPYYPRYTARGLWQWISRPFKHL